MNTDTTDYKAVISELIKKQIVILGPDITIAKVRNVSGIQVGLDGQVVSITGDPKQILQRLIDSFVELSGLIVRKTMESILPGSSSMLVSPPVTKPLEQSIPKEEKNEAPIHHEDSIQDENALRLRSEDVSPSAIQDNEATSNKSNENLSSLGVQEDHAEIEGNSAEAHQSAIDEALASLGEVAHAQSGQAGPSSVTEKIIASQHPQPDHTFLEENDLLSQNLNVPQENHAIPKQNDFSNLRNIPGGI